MQKISTKKEQASFKFSFEINVKSTQKLKKKKYKNGKKSTKKSNVQNLPLLEHFFAPSVYDI